MDEKELAAYEAGKIVGEYIGFNKCLKINIILFIVIILMYILLK
jgi:hypothetical protein